MHSAVLYTLAVFTGILLVALGLLQAAVSGWLRQLFNDTGRRSEGRRQRRVFEWWMRGFIGCVNYGFSLQDLKDLPLEYLPGAETWLVAGQCGLGLAAIGCLFAAGLQLRDALGYST